MLHQRCILLPFELEWGSLLKAFTNVHSESCLASVFFYFGTFLFFLFLYDSPLSKKELDIQLTYLHRPSSIDHQRYRVPQADGLVISQPFEVCLLSRQNDRH